jgi:excisionase family DNA binding protein
MAAVVMEPIAVGVKEAALLLGLGKSSVRRLIRDGDLPFAKVGDRILIRRSALEELLNTKQV